MAIGDSYATAAQYRAAVTKSSSAQDTELGRDLLAISRVIEHEVGRIFNKDAAPVSVYFDPAESASDPDGCGYNRSLRIGDFVSVSAVALDSSLDDSFATALTLTDYQLRPRNAALAPEPEPYTDLYMPGFAASSYGYWPSTQQVRVTGIRGWPSVPAVIQRACIDLTSLLRLETPRASREMVAADMIVATSKEAQSIVSRLMDVYNRTGGIAVA